jgi:hypothetical protein
MDNFITGFIAVAVFLSFVLGLAISIGTIPFGIIVVVVSGMVLVEFYQSAKQGLEDRKNK